MKKGPWVGLLLCFMYSAAHLVTYAFVILPWFAYRGYRVFIPSWEVCAIIVALLLAPGLFLPTQDKKIGDVAPWVLYASIYVPGVYIPMLSLKRDPWDILTLSVMHLVGLAVFEVGRKAAVRMKLKKVENTAWLPQYVLPISALILAFIFWQAIEFRLDLSWDNIYVRRADTSDMTGTQGLIGYLNQVFIKVMIPALALFGWMWKSARLWIVCLICCLISWAFDAYKLVLFMPLLIIAVMLLERSKRPTINFMISLTVGLLVFIGIEAMNPSPQGLGAEMAEGTIKRALYETGLLTGFYWDHFTIYPLNNFGGSALTAPFVSTPYDGISIPKRIGFMYFGNATEGANASMVASAIGDMGIWGVPVVCLLAGFVVRMFEVIGAQRSKALAFAFILVIAQDWSNRAFQTSLLTGGVMASFILLWFYSDPKPKTVPAEDSDTGPAAAPSGEPA